MLELNLEKLIERFNLENDIGLQHNSEVHIFPFNTSGSNDFKDFNKIQGEIYSNIVLKENIKKIDKKEIIDRILRLVETKNKTELIEVIDKTFFRSEGIVKLHPKIYIYDNNNPSTNIRKMGNFLFKLFFHDKKINARLQSKFFSNQEELSNPLETVFYRSLPELKEFTVKEYNFLFDLEHIQKKFSEDFLFIIESSTDFIFETTRLLKYYYFFYITQLALKIDSELKGIPHNENSDLYYTLENEKLSKTRVAYKRGWNSIEEKLNTLFSYRLVLDIINENNAIDSINLENLKGLSITNKEKFAGQVNRFTNLYREKIDAQGIMNYEPTLQNECILMREIEKLFKILKYQFINSNRSSANKKYTKCFTKFCKANFLKRRGRLGYSLNIDQFQLLFMAKIVIKEDQRIQLQEFWDRLSDRGINFDKVSRKNIIEMFDEMNILGKESDSGDAKYIRKI